MTENNKTLCRHALCAAVVAGFVLALVSFVLTPLNADIHVFTASANIADYKDVNLFWDAYNTWELKGVFNRVLVYAIYKIATVFTDFGTFPFERATKLIYAVGIILLCAASVRLACRERSRFFKALTTLLLSSVFLTAGACADLEAEMSGTLLLVFGFALYVNAEKSNRRETLKIFLAGMCIGAVFFFKSATLIMSVAFVAAAYLWDVHHGNRPTVRKFILLVAGSVAMLAAGFLSILLLNPAEFRDMLYASMFQGSLFNGAALRPVNFLRQYVTVLTNGIPFLMIGTVAIAFNALRALKDRAYPVAAMHIVLWAIPSAFVVISAKYFGYHYFTFVFPAIVETALFAESLTEPKLRHIKAWAMPAACLAAVVFWGAFISVFSPKFEAYVRLTETAYARNAEITAMNFDEPVLYLDDGTGAYMLGADSYLKYFFPLPIQRITDDSKYRDAECRLETLRRIEQYRGKYIVVNGEWLFGGDKNGAVKEKVLREYDRIGALTRYTPQHKAFRCDTEKDFRVFDLYRRKTLPEAASTD